MMQPTTSKSLPYAHAVEIVSRLISNPGAHVPEFVLTKRTSKFQTKVVRWYIQRKHTS